MYSFTCTHKHVRVTKFEKMGFLHTNFDQYRYPKLTVGHWPISWKKICLSGQMSDYSKFHIGSCCYICSVSGECYNGHVTSNTNDDTM